MAGRQQWHTRGQEAPGRAPRDGGPRRRDGGRGARRSRLAAALALGLAAVLALTASACGGGSDDTQQYEEAVAGAIVESSTEGGGEGVSTDNADCFADRAVSIIGVDTFTDAGVSPEDVRNADGIEEVVQPTEEQANELVDAVFECIDVAGLFVEGFTASAEGEGFTLAQEKLDCLGRNFEQSEQVRALFAQSLLSGDDPDIGADDGGVILEILGDCLTLEDLVKIGLATGGDSTGASTGAGGQ